MPAARVRSDCHAELQVPLRAKQTRTAAKSRENACAVIALLDDGRHDEWRLSSEFTDFEAEITVVSLSRRSRGQPLNGGRLAIAVGVRRHHRRHVRRARVARSTLAGPRTGAPSAAQMARRGAPAHSCGSRQSSFVIEAMPGAVTYRISVSAFDVVSADPTQ
jgi:hypothetical protein